MAGVSATTVSKLINRQKSFSPAVEARVRAAIESLEDRWFAPLRKALLKGQLKTLHIEASTVYAKVGWQCERNDQWKFWKKSRRLADLAMALAKAEA